MSILKRKDAFGHSLFVIRKETLKRIANNNDISKELFKRVIMIKSTTFSSSMKKDDYVPILTVGDKLFFGKIGDINKDIAVVHWKRKDNCDLPMKYKISN